MTHPDLDNISGIGHKFLILTSWISAVAATFYPIKPALQQPLFLCEGQKQIKSEVNERASE